MTKILVIEDDPYICESIQDVLEIEGYQTLTASNGVIGVQLATSELPDLILCDVGMPEMDGYEVLNILRHHPVANTIPFIFLTARTTSADLRQGMNLGADDYVPKPCTAHELLNTITSRLAKQAIVKTKSEQQLTSLRNNISQSLPHELYTPLNGILGFSELLVRDYETIDRQEIHEIAEGIYLSAQRLHHLMQNFLLYAKLEMLRHQPEQLQELQSQTTFDPVSIIRFTAEKVAAHANRSADLTLVESSSQAAECLIKISSHYLQKVVEELVDNALKFSEPAAKITITTGIHPPYFYLSITDQGRGMTAEQIANLGAYMQFDRKYYEQQGSGLGLVITQRMTELYGGHFHIQSTIGEQTTVQLKFPLVFP
ncbi:MAG: response regulator [Elainella sp. Prado103]|jgi:signal transduction histidine kinase|nr:response regulator [Elainella sp. Prado103]